MQIVMKQSESDTDRDLRRQRKELEELEQRINELKAAIGKEEKQSVDIERFLALVRKYTDLQELTAEIVREFIEKIYVYQTQTINGHRVRRIKIVYNCIGAFTAPEQEKTV